jgi:two-component system OmpR family sensor kinase
MFAFLRRIPLRVKLIASVLALVAATLTVIAVSVTYEMSRFLNGQVDSQLTSVWPTINPADIGEPNSLPSNWLIAAQVTSGKGRAQYSAPLTQSDLPKFPTTVAQLIALGTKPYTVKSVNGHVTWRMLAGVTPTGAIVFVGQTLTSVQASIHKLIVMELIAGGATLVLLGSAGAGMIRTSLRPLDQIEHTAAAIAAGDLTKRVPDFEPPGTEPRTEVGRLGQSLNAMLEQIETSFAARTASEIAAREAAESAHLAAEAAQRSEGRAIRSEERTRQFAADASHELRTPLTTIRGFAELYRQGAAREPEETARLIRRIEDEAARMGLLVEDMLLLARLDQERPLAELPVDLRVIGADTVINASAVAQTRDLGLDIDENAGSLVVVGDELRLRQVMTNLMTNALTYTPPESPISVHLGRSERPGFVEISVVDSGPGLTAEQIDHIFERFYRADTVRTRRSPGDLSSGTGLGLAIVAAIVKAHGGTIDVSSISEESVQDGQKTGATFRVTLPAAPVDQDQALAVEAAPVSVGRP